MRLRTIARKARRRVSGQRRLLGIGILVSLLLGCAGFAVGHSSGTVTVRVGTADAVLPNDARGSLSIVNGPSGRTDAEVPISGSQGHPLTVSQQGDTVLLQDGSTGVIDRIDLSQLTVGASVDAPRGTVVVAGPAATYLLDAAAGTVTRIDPVTLRDLSPSYHIDGRLGQAVVDAAGRLWVPVLDAGTVVPVTVSGPGTAVTVAAPGADVALTVAGGQPVAVDQTTRQLVDLTPSGVDGTVALPAGSGGAEPTDLLPPTTAGVGTVPILDPTGTPSLLVVDLANATTRSVPLGGAVTGDQFGPPVQAGARVFVPDYTKGIALVYDTATGQAAPSVTVTGTPGTFDSEVLDGIAYFNDPGRNDAVAITPDGDTHHVDKTGVGVPVVTPTPTPTPPPIPTARQTPPTTTDVTSPAGRVRRAVGTPAPSLSPVLGAPAPQGTPRAVVVATPTPTAVGTTPTGSGGGAASSPPPSGPLAGPGCSSGSADFYSYDDPSSGGWHTGSSGGCGQAFIYTQIADHSDPDEWDQDAGWTFDNLNAPLMCTLAVWIPASPQADGVAHYWLSSGSHNYTDNFLTFTIDQAAHQGAWYTTQVSVPQGTLYLEIDDNNRGNSSTSLDIAASAVGLSC